jgi:hypothetical protein
VAVANLPDALDTTATMATGPILTMDRGPNAVLPIVFAAHDGPSRAKVCAQLTGARKRGAGCDPASDRIPVIADASDRSLRPGLGPHVAASAAHYEPTAIATGLFWPEMIRWGSVPSKLARQIVLSP